MMNMIKNIALISMPPVANPAGWHASAFRNQHRPREPDIGIVKI